MVSLFQPDAAPEAQGGPGGQHQNASGKEQDSRAQCAGCGCLYRSFTGQTHQCASFLHVSGRHRSDPDFCRSAPKPVYVFAWREVQKSVLGLKLCASAKTAASPHEPAAAAVLLFESD